MSRAYQSGFETGSVSSGLAGHEWDTVTGSPTIQTTTVRTGTYAAQISLAGVAQYFGLTLPSAYYLVRAYLNIGTLPAVTTTILSTSGNPSVQLLSTGRLQLTAVGTVRGTGSILSAGWHRVEMGCDGGTYYLYLDGVLQASYGSAALATQARIGGNINAETDSTAVLYFDDIAINDNSGAPTGLPGDGAIVHLMPNGAGDNNGFGTQVGGTAGSANNYTRVNEVNPNDATSYNGSNVLGTTDDFVISAPPNIATGIVLVGIRARGSAASADSSFQVRCKKTSGGTVASSAAITPTGTVWFTNGESTRVPFPLVLNNDPDGVAWNSGSLSTTQIGYTISTGNTNRADISTIWASLDYTPSVDPFPAGYQPNNPLVNSAIYRMRHDDPEQEAWLRRAPHRRRPSGLYVV